MKEITYEQALQRLTAWCAKGEHSTGEAKDKLFKLGLHETERQRVIDYLTDNGYIDDKRYAQAYIKDKLVFNGWGPKKIVQGLRQKGIDSQTCNAMISEIDDDVFAEKLLPLMQKKLRTLSADHQRDSLIRFAAQRGFTWQQIDACLKQIQLTQTDDETQWDLDA